MARPDPAGDGPARHRFAVDPRFRGVLALFGVRSGDDAVLEIGDGGLSVRFGYWSLSTPARNLAGATATGPYSAPKVLGARLSLADRGLTFGTTTRPGVCIRFRRPVLGIEPTGTLRHPGLTVTVEDPDALARDVRRFARAHHRTADPRPGRTPQPGRARRALALARYPLGLVVSTARYLWWSGRVENTETAGDASDLPPALPPELLDAELTTVDDGSGPLLHRRFRAEIRDGTRDAAGLIAMLAGDLDRGAPSEVTTFRKTRGRLGELRSGDEYRVRMPAPWDGPVRVVHRDRTSFRFATLATHLEAGQIEFSARDTAGGLHFEIETWARAGDPAAAVVIDRLRIGKEIQLHMWTQFCLSACTLAGGRLDTPVTVSTRRVPWPPAGREN